MRLIGTLTPPIRRTVIRHLRPISLQRKRHKPIVL
nr:MAG TPA: hypothetical protein [Caudoviricetes sp.]DAX08619.1 MAG TPA: hypothetical protein [Bacteriophage sp.]